MEAGPTDDPFAALSETARATGIVLATLTIVALTAGAYLAGAALGTILLLMTVATMILIGGGERSVDYPGSHDDHVYDDHDHDYHYTGRS